MSLCHLGIMGTQYVRSTQIETKISLMIDNVYSTIVYPIYASIEIGNTLDIHMRQNPSQKLDWVSIFQGNPTEVRIQPAGLFSGEFLLILESYDSAGGVYSTLKTDQIQLKVCPIRKFAIVKAKEEL